MREIKFRAWTNGKYYYPTTGGDLGEWLTNDRDIPYDLEQYTGLKDKNGREIYEGDIMEYKLNGETRRDFVRFVQGAFGIIGPSPMHDDLRLDLALTCVHDAYVIGNIHETRSF